MRRGSTHVKVMDSPTFEEYCQLIRQKLAIEAELIILEKRISLGIGDNPKEPDVSSRKRLRKQRQAELEEELLSEPEVLKLAGVAGWETLAGHIANGYFPQPETVISGTRYWLPQDLSMWQAWKEAKPEIRRSYRKWLGSTDDEDFNEFAKKHHGFPPPPK